MGFEKLNLNNPRNKIKRKRHNNITHSLFSLIIFTEIIKHSQFEQLQYSS